jgi:hypothetical protein
MDRGEDADTPDDSNEASQCDIAVAEGTQFHLRILPFPDSQ